MSRLVLSEYPSSTALGRLLFAGLLFAGLFLSGSLFAQDDLKPVIKPAPQQALRASALSPINEALPAKVEDSAADTATQQRLEKFAAYMTGAKLKGRFTIQGKDDKMPEETYTIAKCEKLPEGNLYRFTARIQYGDTDTELPMDIPVEWAGDTPVISLTNMWLPGMGTFSARVLIYKDTYAGTWMHDDVGGQMFGVILKDTETAETKPAGEGKE